MWELEEGQLGTQSRDSRAISRGEGLTGGPACPLPPVLGVTSAYPKCFTLWGIALLKRTSGYMLYYWGGGEGIVIFLNGLLILFIFMS